MHIYHGIQYPQRVQRTLIHDLEIIRVRLDPAERELRALLYNFTTLTGELEMPTPRSRDALDGHDCALAHPVTTRPRTTPRRGSRSRSSLS